MRRALLSASLFAIASQLGAMEPGPSTPLIKPTLVTGEQSISLDTADLSQVAKGRFFISRDGGATWTLAQETAVDPTKPVTPVFAFKPQGDGNYYIVTATVSKNGSAEAAPAPGSVPGKALLLVVDATPPVVATLEAVPEPVTDPNATAVTVNVTWAITDANFQSATLELSIDGGASFVAAQAIAASGTVKLTVPRTRDNSAQLRIIAKDAAGNQAPSLAKTIALPVPPDPEKALDAAVKGLPTLADVQPVPDAAPVIAASTAAAIVTSAKPATSAATSTSAPAAASTSATATPPAPLITETQPTVSTTTDRTITPPAKTTFLTGQAAEDQLGHARDLRDAKDIDGAHAVYLRLQDSTVAKIAVAEDLSMLASVGDHAAVATIAESLRPELRTDAVRLLHGKALLLLGKPAEAEKTLLGVRKGSDESREALLFIGKASFAQGKTAIATKIYEKLATGSDAIAEEAKLLRGK